MEGQSVLLPFGRLQKGVAVKAKPPAAITAETDMYPNSITRRSKEFYESISCISSCSTSRSNGLARIGALRVIGLSVSRISCG
ncbi:hypothetical protein PMI27_000866 [Pseudomonas sp. GM41(2012)]|nr:hypothetical protein PMI27_000866 [Pseudomonas sp. GM41(2012)]